MGQPRCNERQGFAFNMCMRWKVVSNSALGSNLATIINWEAHTGCTLLWSRALI